MTIYETIKTIHITTALLSISGFILRGVWMMHAPTILKNVWVRIVPHINDTILLLSAIVLVIITAQYPISTIWINAKIIALVIYIVLGMIALKWGETMAIRVIAWGLAILVFTYIFAVANSKNVIIL